jgi:hypothetical protein
MQHNVQHIELLPTEAKPYIQWLLAHKKAFMLHGSPSTAKSWLMRQVCDEMDLKLVDCRLTQYDSVDLRGLPDLPVKPPEVQTTEDMRQWLKTARVNWIAPEIMPRPGDPAGCLFLDELPNSSNDVQAASYQLILDRALGMYELPDNWAVAAAGNYRTDMALVNQMASALKNRFYHLHLRTSVEDYAPVAQGLGIHPMIIGFLRFKPNKLNAFDNPTDETAMQYIKNSDAFHTSRTWEMASDVLNDFGVDRFEESFPLIAGSIGVNAATELQGFVKYYSKLPDLDDLIENPGKHRVPDEMQTRYALAAALCQRTTLENFEQVLKFMRRMPAELQSAFIADCLRRDDEFADLEAFAEWTVDNSANLF